MNPHSDLVKKQFDQECETYDQEVRVVLPAYEEMNQCLLNTLKFTGENNLKILELGIGTGEIARLLLEKFPNSHLTGVDLSLQMMNIAKKKLKDSKLNVKFIQEDIIDFKPTEQYDLVVGVLSIHHLDIKQKEELYKTIFNSLSPKGIFAIGDLITGENNKETKKLEADWRNHLVNILGEEGAEEWLEICRKEDIPESISTNLGLLSSAGFVKGRLVWRNGNCAVFEGRKS